MRFALGVLLVFGFLSFETKHAGTSSGQTVSPGIGLRVGEEGAELRVARSVWPCRIQRDLARDEGDASSFLSIGGLVTLLQSAARAAAKVEGKI